MAALQLVLDILAKDSASGPLDHVAKSAAKVGHDAEAGAGRGKVAFSSLFSTLSANSNGAFGPLQEIMEKAEGLGEAFEHGRKKVGAALLGIGSVATGVGALLSSWGSKDQAAQGRLKAAVEATGHSFGPYKEELEKAVKAHERFGETAPTTTDALQRLTLATHDPKQAFELLTTAQNVAAAKQIDLVTAASLVGKAYNGNAKVLKDFGISVARAIDPQKTLSIAQDRATRAADKLKAAQESYHDKLRVFTSIAHPTIAQQIALEAAHRKVADATIRNTEAQKGIAEAQTKIKESAGRTKEALEQLSQVTAGQADAAANTFSGHLQALKAHVEDSAAAIGGKLGGTLLKIGPALAGVGAIIESTAAIQQMFAARSLEAAVATEADTVATSQGVIARTASAIATGLATAATGAWTAAQWLLNAALDANPIGLLVIALAALVGGLILAWRESATFRDIVQGAMNAVTSAADAVLGFFREHWPLILALLTGPIGVAVLEISRHWDSIKSGAQAAWNAIKSVITTALDAIKAVIDAVWTGIQVAFSAYLDAVKLVVTTYFNAYKTVIETVLHAIEAVVGAAWDGIKAVFTKALEVIRAAVEGEVSGLRNAFSTGLDALTGVARAAWNAVTGVFTSALTGIHTAVATGIDGVVALLRGLGSLVRAGVGDLGSVLLDAGRQVIEGLLRGITEGFQKVKDTLGTLTNLLPSWKGPPATDATILHGAGRLVMAGFSDGLRSGFGDVRSVLGDATDLLALRHGSASTAMGRLGPAQDPLLSELRGLRRDIAALPAAYRLNARAT